MSTLLGCRLAAAGLAIGAGAVGVLVAPTPAQALPGLVSVFATSPVDSTMTRTVTATCPAGTTVVGGGGYASSGAPDQVFLTGLRPLVSVFGTGFQALATEDDTGYGGDWSVAAYAICAPAPPGLGYGWNTSPSGSQSSRTVAAACAPGKKVLGSGGVIVGGGRHVGLTYVLPTPDLTQVVVQAHEDETGHAGSWSVTSWVVCADPVPGLERVVAGPQTWPTSAVAACPSPKRVLGVGGVVTNGAGQVRLLRAYPWASVGAWVVGWEDETGYGGQWTPTAIAICGY
jgi:hypothetical protein